jgi:hypothetical protein
MVESPLSSRRNLAEWQNQQIPREFDDKKPLNPHQIPTVGGGGLLWLVHKFIIACQLTFVKGIMVCFYGLILPAYIHIFTLLCHYILGYTLFSVFLTISFLLYSFAVLTQYNLNHYNGWCHLKLAGYWTKMSTNRFSLPFSRLFGCSTIGVALKVPSKR